MKDTVEAEQADINILNLYENMNNAAERNFDIFWSAWSHSGGPTRPVYGDENT